MMFWGVLISSWPQMEIAAASPSTARSASLQSGQPSPTRPILYMKALKPRRSRTAGVGFRLLQPFFKASCEANERTWTNLVKRGESLVSSTGSQHNLWWIVMLLSTRTWSAPKWEHPLSIRAWKDLTTKFHLKLVSKLEDQPICQPIGKIGSRGFFTTSQVLVPCCSHQVLVGNLWNLWMLFLTFILPNFLPNFWSFIGF
jgi:hypothetical protein